MQQAAAHKTNLVFEVSSFDFIEGKFTTLSAGDSAAAEAPEVATDVRGGWLGTAKGNSSVYSQNYDGPGYIGKNQVRD